jgi:hypothetical protein
MPRRQPFARRPSPTPSWSRAPASTTSRSITSRSPSTSWWSSPARRARASRRWPSTRSTPRASAATSSRCRPTPGSSSARWRSRSTSASAGCRRRSRFQQKSAASNPRSTVGTITEIYDYLRVLYARAGEQRCHQCGGAVAKRSAAEVVDELAALPDKTQVTLFAPKADNRKGEFRELLADARKAGFVRVRIDGMIIRLEDVEALEKQKKHTIELVIDRVTIGAENRGRLTDSVETALREGKGKLVADVAGERTPRVYSEDNSCPTCGIGFPRAVAAVVLVQLAAGHVRRVQRPRRQAAGRPRADHPGPGAQHQRRARSRCGATRSARTPAGPPTSSRRIAKSFKIDLDKPWAKLGDKAREVLLYGTGEKRVAVEWNGRHSSGAWDMKFEGILPQLERRHRESSSDRVRAHYESFFRAIRLRDLPRHPPAAGVAGGVRRRPVGGRRHPDHRAPGLRLHHRAQADRQPRADRRRGAQGDQEPADVPARRRPRVPDARSRRRHAVGRRGPAHPAGVAARLRAVGRAVRARRAVDRPAPARQRAADPHACTGCATWATPCWWSSTTRRRWRPPTG